MELINNSLFNDANLVAYYKMEDANDSKGTFTLTNNGAIAFNAAKFNNGGDFGENNTTKWFATVSNLGIAGNGSIGLSMWIRTYSEAGTNPFFAHYSQTTADRYFLCYYIGSSVYVDNSGGVDLSYTNVVFGTNNFNHVVINRLGASGLEIYVNGTLGTTSVTQGTFVGGANEILLGTDGATGNRFSGIFDDIGIFSRGLTQNEVNSLYSSSKYLGKVW